MFSDLIVTGGNLTSRGVEPLSVMSLGRNVDSFGPTEQPLQAGGVLLARWHTVSPSPDVQGPCLPPPSSLGDPLQEKP